MMVPHLWELKLKTVTILYENEEYPIKRLGELLFFNLLVEVS